MGRVIWTETAELARDRAIEYIAKYSLDAALEQFDEIENQTENLLMFPNLGRSSRVRGARELIINRTSFLVVYRALGENIHIFRFYHTARKR